MSTHFTKEQRQEIVKEFAIRHNGTFNAALFFDEVERVGEQHAAYNWFEWDLAKAAREFQLDQARDFARGLKVTFTVEEVGRRGSVKVKTAEMPLVISPMRNRNDGGGYVLSDPGSDEHQREHCRQAAGSLRTWLNRYEAALIYIDAPPELIEKLIKNLEEVQSAQVEAA